MKSAGLKKRTIEDPASGVVFYYAERGRPSQLTNKPSLLILHGFSESMETWAEVVCHLPRQNHVILLDLPGHGAAPLKFTSATGRAMYDFPHSVKTFIELKSLHRLPSGLHLFGHSWGGFVAAQTAALHNDASALGLCRLSLAAPAMITPVLSPFWEAVEKGKFEDWMIPTTFEGNMQMVKNVTGMSEQDSRKSKTKKIVKGLMELRLPYVDVLRKVWASIKIDLDVFPEIENGWRNIGVKTQLIWGTADVIVDISGATRLSTVIPDSFVELMEGKPHGINLVFPREVADLIVKFQNMTIANKETTRKNAIKAQPSDSLWKSSENHNKLIEIDI